MKTWEMIKELTANPDKEFISHMKKGSRDVLKTKSINGAIRFSNEEDKWHEVLIGVDLDREWEEVKKPVHFMTAIKSGRKIRVEHALISGNFSRNYKWLGQILERFTWDFSDYEIVDIIQNGKWYISEIGRAHV